MVSRKGGRRGEANTHEKGGRRSKHAVEEARGSKHTCKGGRRGRKHSPKGGGGEGNQSYTRKGGRRREAKTHMRMGEEGGGETNTPTREVARPNLSIPPSAGRYRGAQADVSRASPELTSSLQQPLSLVGCSSSLSARRTVLCLKELGLLFVSKTTHLVRKDVEPLISAHEDLCFKSTSQGSV